MARDHAAASTVRAVANGASSAGVGVLTPVTAAHARTAAAPSIRELPASTARSQSTGPRHVSSRSVHTHPLRGGR